MQVLNRAYGALHYRVEGPDDAPVVVFANSLWTDLRLWDALLPLPQGARHLHCDKQGHGLSDLMQATAALIRGASFDSIPGAGHLPCVETTAAHAAIIASSLERHAQ